MLSLMLMLTGLIGLCITANAEYKTGDVIEFGNYPQSKVTSPATITSLNNFVGSVANWKSYAYYSGTGSTDNGTMTAKDFMRYKDVFYAGVKYRGVYFNAYRPTMTGYQSDFSKSMQDDNGYTPGQIYWFKYEPLKWRVLDAKEGLVMTESVIDSQAYNNYVKKNNNEYYNESGRYASEWSTSSLRTWLNNDFFGTAFSATQKENIKSTHLYTLSTDQNKYDALQTDDRVYLLSYEDALNTAYGFKANNKENDPARTAKGTDYAKCQGLQVLSGYSYWRLRSPESSNSTKSVLIDGTVRYGFSVAETAFGIRPVCNLSELKNDNIHIGSVAAVTVPDVNIRYNGETTLKPQVNADYGAQYTVKYESYDTKIATVDENGKIHGAKTGTTYIMVTVIDENGSVFTESGKVTVKYAWWQWLIIIFLFGWIWY